MGPLTRAVLLEAEERSTVVAEKYLASDFNFPRDWLHIHFSDLNPHHSLERARKNVEFLSEQLYAVPEAARELSLILSSLKAFEVRCGSFYRDLEDILKLCEPILHTRVLDKAQEQWLKGQLRQFSKAFELMVELEDSSVIQRKSYNAVIRLRDRLRRDLKGIEYMDVQRKLEAFDEPLLNMEIELLMTQGT